MRAFSSFFLERLIGLEPMLILRWIGPDALRRLYIIYVYVYDDVYSMHNAAFCIRNGIARPVQTATRDSGVQPVEGGQAAI